MVAEGAEEERGQADIRTNGTHIVRIKVSKVNDHSEVTILVDHLGDHLPHASCRLRVCNTVYQVIRGENREPVVVGRIKGRGNHNLAQPDQLCCGVKDQLEQGSVCVEHGIIRQSIREMKLRGALEGDSIRELATIPANSLGCLTNVETRSDLPLREFPCP